MFKKVFIFLLIFVLFPLTIFAASSNTVQIIELEWDAVASKDVTGYNVYRSTKSNTYDFSKPLNSKMITTPDSESNLVTYKDVISEPYEGRYYYVVTSTDGINISKPSNEVTTRIDTIPPAPPGTLKRKVYIRVNGMEIIVNTE